jgi:hypothetical protein
MIAHLPGGDKKPSPRSKAEIPLLFAGLRERVG